MDREANESGAGFARLGAAAPETGRLILAAAIGALVSIGAQHLSFASPAEAQRSGPAGAGILNPADQRNRMIAELRELNTKIDKLERALTSKTLDVNVVSMPTQAGTGD